EFNQALQRLTDRFETLGQLRTNEVFLDSPWELREFRMQPDNGLVSHSVVRNPGNRYASFISGTEPDNLARLDEWLRRTADDISLDTFPVPEKTPDRQPFIGAAASTPGPRSAWT